MKRAAKLCHGNYSDIDNAIKDGIINQNDLVVTKDTKELIYINEDGEKEEIKGKIDRYNSIEDAINDITTIGDIAIGQVVMILDDDKYVPYVVQKLDETFLIEPVACNEIEPLSNSDIENILKNL